MQDHEPFAGVLQDPEALEWWGREQRSSDVRDNLDPEGWAAIVRRWRTLLERAEARQAWDAAVKRGENPTPYEP